MGAKVEVTPRSVRLRRERRAWMCRGCPHQDRCPGPRGSEVDVAEVQAVAEAVARSTPRSTRLHREKELQARVRHQFQHHHRMISWDGLEVKGVGGVGVEVV